MTLQTEVSPPSEADHAELVGPKFLLIKRGLYWRPNSCGYTGLKSEAGRYTAEEAKARADHDLTETTSIREDEAPEFAPNCYEETKVKYLTHRVKELEEAVAHYERQNEGFNEIYFGDQTELATLRAENERLRRALDYDPRARTIIGLMDRMDEQEVRANLAEAQNQQMRTALEWYGENARLCRLIHSEGEKGRNALAEDGGARARASLALNKEESR